MEIRTTIKDFPKQIKRYHIPPETSIRVIIGDFNAEEDLPLPLIKPEEQRHLLNLIPNKYENASEELIGIIEESRMNTDDINL